MIPTPRLWVGLFALALPMIAAGFVPGIGPGVALLDVVLLAFAAVDYASARSALLEVRRVLPPKLSVGAANRFELHCLNRSPRSFRIAARDTLPESFEVTPEQLEATLPGASRLRLDYRATPAQRGKFEMGDLAVRVRGPLGLVWHERIIPARVEVSVYPDLRGASRLLLAEAAMDLANLGLRQLRRDGRGTEFARLRDYAQGDSVRDIDWKATARRSKPVTRVMESERSQTVLLCIDAGRSMAGRIDGLTKLDHAVNAALFLAFVALRNGDRVGLAVFSDDLKRFIAPAAGRTQYRKLVDALYSTQPALTYVDYLALFKELSLRQRRRSFLCLFTDLLDEEQASGMLRPFEKLARHHVPLCVTVRDTSLAALLRSTPELADDAFRQAVAGELLHEREQLKARIARKGVHLVDVTPDELSVAAVNRYLELKSRGAL